MAMSQGYNSSVDINADQFAKDSRIDQIGIDQRLGQPVMKFAEFTDDAGKKIKFSDLLGARPLILLPIFYRCTGVCNLELTGVVDTVTKMKNREVGKDFDVVAVGINPKETYELARAKKAQTLQTYGRPKSASGWHFLTGNMQSIRAVTDSLGFKFNYDADKDQVSHPSGIMILTPKGTISSYILGANYSEDEFNRFLNLAAKEQVGQKSREIFFGCIHLDPVTGKRSIVIENVLKVLGCGTVLAIALTIGVLSGKISLRRRVAA